MKKDGTTEHYENGERECPLCSVPLPAYSTWPGARYRFCGKAACAEIVRNSKNGHYINEAERKCMADGCSNFLAEGLYDKRARFIACSPKCYLHLLNRGSIVMTCACRCGTEFNRASRRPNKSGLVFYSPQHAGAYSINKHLDECCGQFRSVVDEFLQFASSREMDVKTIRKSICPFFEFLNEQHIVSLDQANSRTITEYLVWAERTGHRSAAHDLTCVASFFNWLIFEGHRTLANPVVPRFHYPRKKEPLPRTYTESDLNVIWQLLIERGDSMTRLAAAIAEEAGLRIGEICRLRVTDVNISEKRLFVRLPTKNRKERWAYFSEKTKKYFVQWMSERDPNCGHDSLFYNSIKHPLTADALRDAFQRVLCKTFEGKEIHKTGLDKWSTHRLRHTMASNLTNGGADAAVVMAAGGWSTFDSMSRYAQVDEKFARRGYHDAMSRAVEQKQTAPAIRTLTPAELLQKLNDKNKLHDPSGDREHCV